LLTSILSTIYRNRTGTKCQNRQNYKQYAKIYLWRNYTQTGLQKWSPSHSRDKNSQGN